MDTVSLHHSARKSLSSTDLLLHLGPKPTGLVCVLLFLGSQLCQSVCVFVCGQDPLPVHSLGYCSCRASLKARQLASLHIILVFQNYFNYSTSFAFPYKFQNILIYIYETKSCWDGIMLDICIKLGRDHVLVKSPSVYLHLFIY